MVKKSIGYLWRFVLVLAVAAFFVPAASVWSSPEECMHTAEYWTDINKQREADIERRDKNLIASRDAHTDRIQPNSFASGRLGAYSDSMMKTLADPNYPSMSPAEQKARLDANMAIDLQGQFNPLDTPREPGANSLREDQRQHREIPGIRSQIAATEDYIKRCFGGAYVEVSIPEGSFVAYNCSGLEGKWSFFIDYNLREPLKGLGFFNVPPQPEGQTTWLTPPFSYHLDGEAVEGDCEIFISIEHTDAVMEIVVTPDFRALNFSPSSGNAEESRLYICPDQDPMTISFATAYLPFAGQIIMDKHARCQ